MATQIIWDDEPATPPESELREIESPPSPEKPSAGEMHRAMFLGTVDINELIAELNRRGYNVSSYASIYAPATVATSPYISTTTTYAGAYTVPITVSGLGQAATSAPTTTGFYQQMLAGLGSLGKAK